jgi:hypothetical protein
MGCRSVALREIADHHVKEAALWDEMILPVPDDYWFVDVLPNLSAEDIARQERFHEIRRKRVEFHAAMAAKYENAAWHPWLYIPPDPPPPQPYGSGSGNGDAGSGNGDGANLTRK